VQAPVLDGLIHLIVLGDALLEVLEGLQGHKHVCGGSGGGGVGQQGRLTGAACAEDTDSNLRNMSRCSRGMDKFQLHNTPTPPPAL
jgi:hypothetical protein